MQAWGGALVAIVAATGFAAWAWLRAYEERPFEETPLPMLDALAVARRFGIEVPRSEGNEPAAPRDSPLIVVTKTAIRFEDGSPVPLVLPLGNRTTQMEAGAPERFKGRPDGIFISPLAQVLMAREGLDLAPSPGERPISRVLADASVPTRLLFELAATVWYSNHRMVLVVNGRAGEAGYGQLLNPHGCYQTDRECERTLASELLAMGASPTLFEETLEEKARRLDHDRRRRELAAIWSPDAEPPPPSRPGDLWMRDCEPRIEFSDEGARIRILGANVAPGCTRIGEGVAVPLAEGEPDLQGIEECLRTLKQALPTLARSPCVRLHPRVGADLQQRLLVEDAIRRSGSVSCGW